MASITREIKVAAAPEAVWQRVRNVGEAHRLFAGVLTDCRMEEGARTVTFANGMVLRELILDVSDEHRRVAYAAVGGRTTHHNASLQVFAEEGATRSRVVWTLDFLPDELAPAIGALVEAGSAAMKASLESGG
ncbi:MAG: SRPBCC family protein [Ramlibacter sp.]